MVVATKLKFDFRFEGFWNLASVMSFPCGISVFTAAFQSCHQAVKQKTCNRNRLVCTVID